MDIVKKLHEWADFGYGVEASKDMFRAADEIERLRKALQKIADWPDYRSPSHQEIARAALKETE